MPSEAFAKFDARRTESRRLGRDEYRKAFPRQGRERERESRGEEFQTLTARSEVIIAPLVYSGANVAGSECDEDVFRLQRNLYRDRFSWKNLDAGLTADASSVIISFSLLQSTI